MTDLMWLWLLGCLLVTIFVVMAGGPRRRRVRRLSKWSRPMLRGDGARSILD